MAAITQYQKLGERGEREQKRSLSQSAGWKSTWGGSRFLPRALRGYLSLPLCSFPVMMSSPLFLSLWAHHFSIRRYLSLPSLCLHTGAFLLRSGDQCDFILTLSIYLQWSYCQTGSHSEVLGVAVVVQSPSRVRLFVTPWTAAHQASLSITISWSLSKFMSIAPVMPSSHLILLTPYSPSALSLSQHQGLSQWVHCSHQMTKILELQLPHQSFQWIFRVDLP